MGTYLTPEQIFQQMRGQKPQTAVDRILQDMKKYQTEDPYDNDYADDDRNESFGEYIGNLGKFIYNLWAKNPDRGIFDGLEDEMESGKNLALAAAQLTKNVVKTTKDLAIGLRPDMSFTFRPPGESIIKNITQATAEGIKQQLKTVIDDGPGAMAGTIAKGLVESTVESTIEAFTGKINQEGVPVIATPFERAKAIQQVASLYVMGKGYNLVAEKMAGKLTTEGIKALADQPIRSTVAKAALVAGGAGAAGAAAGLPVANLGDDDYIVKTISQSLAGIPLGLLIGTPFELVRGIKLQNAAREVASEAQAMEAVDILSAYGLALTEGKTLKEITTNVAALASADNIADAVIRSVVANNDSWIIPGVSATKVNELLKGVVKPNKPIPPILIEKPSRALKQSPVTYKGLTIKFESEFDKVAYMASKDPKSKAPPAKNLEAYIKEALEAGKGEITREDLIAHGKYIREIIKNKIRTGGKSLERLSQQEIDDIDKAILLRGDNIIQGIPENGTVKDYRNVEWVRKGDMFTDGQQVLPANDRTLRMTLGREWNDVDPLAGKLRFSPLQFRRDFNRVVGDHFVYKRERIVGFEQVPGKDVADVMSTVSKEAAVNWWKGLSKEFQQRVWYEAGFDLTPITEALNNPEMIHLAYGLFNSDPLTPPKVYNDPRFVSMFGGEVVSHAGRTPIPKDIPIKEYDVLITPRPLNKEQRAFFERTGYLKGELATLDGVTNIQIVGLGRKKDTFVVKTVGRGKGKESIVSADRIIKDPEGLRKAYKSMVAFEATTETMFKRFYSILKKKFDDNLNASKDSQRSFEQIFDASVMESGIPSEDIGGLKLATYRQLQDDAIASMAPEEKGVVLGIKELLERTDAETAKVRGNQLYNFARSSGLYVHNKGGGSFEIRQINDGKLLGTFGGVDEALAFIKKTGRNPMLSLDGDGITPIPPAAGELGGMAEPYYGPKHNAWRNGIDQLQIKAKQITPSQDWFAALSNHLDTVLGKEGSNYYKLKISDLLDGLQRGQLAHRSYSEFVLKPVHAGYQRILKLRNKMNEDQLELAMSLVETKSRDEIIKGGLLSRHATPFEITKASEYAVKLSKAGRSAQDIAEAMYAARRMSKSKFGTPEYEAALQSLVKNGMKDPKTGQVIITVDPVVAKAATDIGKIVGNPQVGQDVFSSYLVLRLVDATMNPSHALTKAQFIAKHGLTPDSPVIEMSRMFETFMGDIAKIAEINPKAMINGYVPAIRMKKMLNVWAEGDFPEDFARELARVTLGDDGSMVRDPAQLAYLYMDQMANTKTKITYGGQELNYNQLLNVLNKEADLLADKLNETVKVNRNARGTADIFRESFDRHFSEVTGKVDEAALLKGHFEVLYKNLNIPNPSALSYETAASVVSMATQGYRPIMGFRDYVSWMGNMFTLYGHNFMKEAVVTFHKISDFNIEQLERQGKIYIVGGAEFASPSSTRLATGLGGKVSRATDMALRGSMQHHVYRKQQAAMYYTTQNLVLKYTDLLRNNKIDKATAYNRLELSVHSDMVAAKFDAFIKSGDIQGAVDYLAKQNIKRAINLYGYGNAPVGWGSNVGKLFGQYGSWGSNYVATGFNAGRNLNAPGGLTRILRWGTYNGLVYAAAKLSGLRLDTFLLTPTAALPSIGPVVAAWQDMTDAAGMATSTDPRLRDLGLAGFRNVLPFKDGDLTDLARLYLPFSYQVRDAFRGISMFVEGDPILGALQAFGIKPQQP